MGSDYDEIARLIDTDPIALGERCRKAEADRDAARDLAFRAAFAVEEGSGFEWGVEFSGGARSYGSRSACDDYLRRHEDARLIRRAVGPWQFAPHEEEQR